LIGDPGSGKSQMLKRISVVAPKARYVSGKGASGAGLTAAVVKDEFLKGWSLEAGALVLTNGGQCMIDELDKMGKDDRAAMHEALEQQTVSIAKANIQATLRAETTVLAAANPKFGRFDPYDTIAAQIDLPPTLINRFDLIFPIKDIPNEEKDEKMAKFILSLHKDTEINKGEIDTDFFKKYVAFAKQHVFPKLTDGAFEEIKDYYVKMRGSGSGEGSMKTIPISARQLEALVRLSEAAAKVRLSDKVTKADAKRAIDLLHYCLTQVGMDEKTGVFDIDRITTGITTTQRSKIVLIREIINELEQNFGKIIRLEDILRNAKEKGVDEDEVEEIIEKLKRSGDIIQPRRDTIQKV
jgi:replicative DNA helicase Mcm